MVDAFERSAHRAAVTEPQPERVPQRDVMLLHDQIDKYESEAEQRVLIHEARAQIRERFATPVAWGATATASIASLSIVSEQEAVAGVFAVITALATTLLAAYEPAEKATEDVKAANEYDHLKRALRSLLTTSRER